MLILTPDTERFDDSDDPGLTYRLPSGLVPSTGSNGIPSILIVQHSGGGSISLALETIWPELTAGEQAVPINGARFRLHAHTPAHSESGVWHDATPNGNALVQRTILLTPIETSIVRRLLTTGDETFSFDVELTLLGRTQVFPWRVSVNTSLLVAKLTSLLPNAQRYDKDEIIRAFGGLMQSDFEWFPQSPKALPVPFDEALFNIANHALAILFEREDAAYQFTDAPPQQLAINLSVPVTTTSRIHLNWSLSEFLSQQTNPERFAYEIEVDSPFEIGELLVTNDLPLHASGIRQLDVEIRTGGPTSEINHGFVSGEPSAARLKFINETFRDRTMSAKVTAVIMKSGRPVIINKSVRHVGTVLSIDKKLLQVEPVRIQAQNSVFNHLASLEVQLGSRLLLLAPEAPELWAIRSSLPTEATLVGVTSSGQRVELGAIAPVNGQFIITESHLGVGEFVDIIFKRNGNIQLAPYLAVRTGSGEWRTFEGRELRYSKVQRTNKWADIIVAYQTRHVPEANDGTTEVMIESSVNTASSNLITLDL